MTLIKWLKKEGEYVDRDEVIAELESEKATFEVNAEKAGVWFSIRRQGRTYESLYSLDGKEWVSTRAGVFTERPVLKVGIVCASPIGDPFKASFDYFRGSDFATFTGTPFQFEIVSVELTFGGNLVLDNLGRMLDRLSRKWYERHAAWMFPALDIRAHLRVVKPV